MKITIIKPEQQPEKKLTVADLKPGQIGIGTLGDYFAHDVCHGKTIHIGSEVYGICTWARTPKEVPITEILPPGTEIKIVVEREIKPTKRRAGTISGTGGL